MEHEQFKRDIFPIRSQLLAYASRLLDNSSDAEDVVQDVFLKLWRMRSELQHYNSITALSVTMTKHLSLNFLKSKQRKKDKLNECTATCVDVPLDCQVEQKEDTAQVIDIISRLPERQQSVLRMKHIEGLKTEEIAEIMGSTPEAVRMNLSRARKKIKEMFCKI